MCSKIHCSTNLNKHEKAIRTLLLFLLYINDLPNISKSLNFYLFADDTNIYYESDSL